MKKYFEVRKSPVKLLGTALLLSSLLLTPVNAFNVESVETDPVEAAVVVTSDASFVTEALANNDENVFAKVADISTEVIVDLDIDIALQTKDTKVFGIIKDGDEKTPIFISSNVDHTDEEYQKILSDVEKARKAKKAKEKLEKNNVIQETSLLESSSAVQYNQVTPLNSSFPNASYSLVGSAVKVWVGDTASSPGSGDTSYGSSASSRYWYTEYRYYKGGSNSTTDLFYLRADHQNLKTKYTDDHPINFGDALYRFTADWQPSDSNVDILDPAPLSDENTFEVTLSLPPTISWGSTFTNSTDIETDVDIVNDKIYWEVDRYSLAEFYMMTDFEFTHGTEIESPVGNNGAKMKCTYKLWGSEPNLTNNNGHEDTWADEVYVVDSTGTTGWRY